MSELGFFDRKLDKLFGLSDPTVVARMEKTERDLDIIRGVVIDRLAMETVAANVGVERSTVYRTIQRAKEKGVIGKPIIDILRFILESGGPRISHATDSRWLVREFPQVRSLAIVHVPQTYSGEEGYNFRDDATLHRILGHVAALELNRLIQPGDKIGIGSGQGMLDFTTAFTEGRVQPAYDDLELYSLVGNLPTYEAPASEGKFHISEYKSHAGADEVVYSLSRTNPQFKVAAIRRAPPYEDSSLARRGIYDLPDRENIIKQPEVDIAVFGLGSVFHPNHQPLMALRGFNPMGSELLEAVHDANDPSGNHPLIEYLNRIAIVDPGLAKHQDLVDRVNSFVVGPTEDSLRSIPIRIGIAGGAHKLAQVRYALANGIVNYLVIDDSTASRLVGTRA